MDESSSMEDKAKAAQQPAIRDWKFFPDHATALARVKEPDALYPLAILAPNLPVKYLCAGLVYSVA